MADIEVAFEPNLLFSQDEGIVPLRIWQTVSNLMDLFSRSFPMTPGEVRLIRLKLTCSQFEYLLVEILADVASSWDYSK